MKKLRKMTWALIAWSVGCLVWIIAGSINAQSGADCASEETPLARRLCEEATDVGTGIGVTLIFGLWFVGFVVLSLIWFMTRPKGD